MAGYIGTTPVPQATQHRESFTATGGQTSFATAGYTPQFIDVYLNGVKLAPADYTATNGSDVVLASGATASDILEIVAYTPFEVANQTFTGTTTAANLTVTGAFTSQGIDDNANAVAITIDSSENVGIGVVPEAWNGLTALQINSQASVSADSSSIQVGANCYYNSGWKYINTAVATNYYQDSGAHVWRTAASGTADAAISWSEAMRISSDGSVGINDSSPDGKLNVVSTAHNNGSIFDSTGTTQLWLRDTDASSNQKNWGFQVSGGSLNILRANDDRASGFVTPIEIQQAPANSFVINSSGSVGIGTSSNLLSGSNRTTVSINNTDSAAIAFGVNGTREGFIYSDTSNLEISSASNFMKFTAGDSERMRILAGGGITFNGDTAAANALDDYEEGTWTPVSDYGTLTSVTATYTKIGNSVFIRLACTMPYTTSSSIMAFAGLPFSTAQDGSAQMGATNSNNYNPSINIQGTTCYFYGASAGQVPASDYSLAFLRFTGQYNTTA